ncbi:hypothetical protein Tco_0460863 [Tanacetum coccineum]
MICITKTAGTKTKNPAIRSGAQVENLAFIQKAAAFAFNAAINEFHAPTGSTSRSFAHVIRVKAVIVELYYGHFQDSRIHFGSVEDGCSGQEWKEGYTQNQEHVCSQLQYPISRTSTPATPVQLTTGQQRAEDTRKTPAEGYQATKEDIIPDESKEEKEKQEKE